LWDYHGRCRLNRVTASSRTLGRRT
jgi:hypothetical protein